MVSADDLRPEGAAISAGLSWERTVEDLLLELKRHPVLRELKQARHLMVTFRSDGALWLERGEGDQWHGRLIFDRGGIEGEFDRQSPGDSFGYLSCFVASVVFHLTAEPPSFEQGIRAGLAAMRKLRETGHGQVRPEEPPSFPVGEIAGAVHKGGDEFACVDCPGLDNLEAVLGKEWMLRGLDRGQQDPRGPLFGIATRIARFGVNRMAAIPCVTLGKLTTVDRHEIERLRQIRELIQDYAEDKHPERPLSLAAFGPPGSGKSFGIKQIAKAALGDEVPFLEFNLSQFNHESELMGALHQVRDKVLEGRLPFVFWDEFDSQELCWLKSFLAPMQDGKFVEDQIAHSIGKCVFVFAGGTSPDFEHFGPPEGDAVARRDFELKKGPDFRSRIGGVLNVLGPNPRIRSYDKDAGCWLSDPDDVCYPVRRAVLLRAKLEAGDKRLDLDPGLLAALLEVKNYRNGARSLEKLAAHLLRKGGSCLRLSHLPPREQLALLVDADDFERILQRFAEFRMRADAIAPAIHELWLRSEEPRREKLHPDQAAYLTQFEQLPAAAKADNYAAARRIVDALALIGLFLVRAHEPADTDPSIVQQLIERHVELLAEAEHEGWLESKQRNGWTYGPVRKAAEREHELLKPYRELSEEQKEKDRRQVRLYPDIVKLAGFMIVTQISDVPG